MKPLFFAISLLFSWQSIASDETTEQTEPQTSNEQKAEKKDVPSLEFIEEKPATEQKSAAEAEKTTAEEKAKAEEAAKTTTDTTISSDEQKATAEALKAVAEVDDSKVLGTQTPAPAEQPKTVAEKQQAVAEAEKAVNQAKEALTAKQQEKARQSRESMAVIEQVIAAYNARNIDAFIKMYDENVEFYTFPNELMFTGKEKLIARYGIMFKKLKCIKSSPIKRIVLGNIVIDHELSETCTQDPKVVDKRSEFVTSYKIENGKITKVLFFR
ncbi:nuclear transport factor 2 family protein [Pseudoalteromonas gelatinilytica]|uniref:SnoaL-like domain-containing protein n=1 Tax=Pseudoalteromonas gelatinilytica TaxID=1703256 RepID=A0ABQ1TF27_9GAMM|nr:nuclear transport factor 2 family protein [Pseudoalteromonas profundi]GGE93962.1 hypothetical protein GCM10008027_18540 [Pseudoalteromonas profundi]